MLIPLPFNFYKVSSLISSLKCIIFLRLWSSLVFDSVSSEAPEQKHDVMLVCYKMKEMLSAPNVS